MDDDLDDDDELANLDLEPPRDTKSKRDVVADDDGDDELLMMCGNEDLMKQ